MSEVQGPPVVLIVAGNDPSGGAGLAADIQAVTAAGVHPAPVVAAVTVQDSRNVTRVEALEPGFVAEQARAVLQDLPVAVVKLGLLADAAIGRAVAGVLDDYPGIPLVIDPVLAASGGAPLAADALLEIYLRELFPRAMLVTPNAPESRRLVPAGADAGARAAALLATGAKYVLIKGADEDTAAVHNHLFGPQAFHEEFTWPRLPARYHGSGCTLASAITARLALGLGVRDAVHAAQRYTWDALQRGFLPGHGQHFPNRLPS